MKIAIIITNDWELFGNGEGDYLKIQKHPLEDLIQCLNKYGVKITLFAEVQQQLRIFHKKEVTQAEKKIAKDWEETLQNLVIQNHDVQLHIHPQLKEGMEEAWSIAEIEENMMLKLLTESKNYLEQTIRVKVPEYNCIAFRAGGYAIQPSEKVIKNLIKTGIVCDSTVSKGLRGSFYNFKRAWSSYLPWPVKSDICLKSTPDKDTILEIPVFTKHQVDLPLLRTKFPRLFYYVFDQIKLSGSDTQWITSTDKNGKQYKFWDKYSLQIKKNLIGVVFSKLDQSSIQFDYDKIPARVFVNEIKTLRRRINNSGLNSTDFLSCKIPVILIGHTKNQKSTYNIGTFLENVKQSGEYDEIVFMTISEYYKDYIENLSYYEKLYQAYPKGIIR